MSNKLYVEISYESGQVEKVILDNVTFTPDNLLITFLPDNSFKVGEQINIHHNKHTQGFSGFLGGEPKLGVEWVKIKPLNQKTSDLLNKLIQQRASEPKSTKPFNKDLLKTKPRNNDGVELKKSGPFNKNIFNIKEEVRKSLKKFIN